MTKRDQSGAYDTLSNAGHKRFIDEYLIDCNGAAAAERAGFSKRRARQTAHELLQRDDIKAAIAEKQARLRAKNEVAAGKVVDELAKLAFANMGDYVTLSGGRLCTDFSKVTRDQMAAVTKLTVKTIPGIEGEDGEKVTPEVTEVRFELADKRGPLVDLGKHLGLFEEYHKNGQRSDGAGAGGVSARELVERRLALIAERDGPQKGS